MISSIVKVINKVIIAVEGMDGSGKTTICKHIEKKYNFINVEKPTKYLFIESDGNINYDAFYEMLNKVYKKSKKYRSAFFGKGNELAIKMNYNSNIVLDRHIASNYYWNGSIFLTRFYKRLLFTCGKPTITIFLYATPKVRYERLKKRDKDDIDLYDKTIFEDGTKRYITFLNKMKMTYVIVDTNNKSINEVYKEVDDIIDRIK